MNHFSNTRPPLKPIVFGSDPKPDEVVIDEKRSSYHNDLERIAMRTTTEVARKLSTKVYSNREGHVLADGHDNEDAARLGFLLMLCTVMTDAYKDTAIGMCQEGLKIGEHEMDLKNLFEHPETKAMAWGSSSAMPTPKPRQWRKLSTSSSRSTLVTLSSCKVDNSVGIGSSSGKVGGEVEKIDSSGSIFVKWSNKYSNK